MDYNKIKLLLTEKGISFKEFTSNIGMSRRGLYAAIDNKTLTVTTLEKIAEFLKVPITVFFQENEINNAENEELKKRILELEDQLDDKRLLLKFIKEQNLIPGSFLSNKGRKQDYSTIDFSNLDTILKDLENSTDDQDLEIKFGKLIEWYEKWKRSKIVK